MGMAMGMCAFHNVWEAARYGFYNTSALDSTWAIYYLVDCKAVVDGRVLQ
jgi:hypothetical protein